MKRIIYYLKKDIVLTVSWVLAAASAFLVRPDKGYAGYIDWRSLGILWSLMIITNGYMNNGIFEKIRHFANEFSTLITWSLESSMETSMSMESRGYGLKGRTSFNRFRFTLKDTFTIIIMLVCFVMAVIPIAGKKLAVYYLPVIYYTKSGVEGVLAVTAFVILTVTPLIIEIIGDVQYKRRSSYNER